MSNAKPATGTMAIEHYKRRVSGDDMGIAGCACRGCAWYRLAAPKCDSAEKRAQLREEVMEHSREAWRFFDAAARRRNVTERNEQVAEPFRALLNSLTKGMAA